MGNVAAVFATKFHANGESWFNVGPEFLLASAYPYSSELKTTDAVRVQCRRKSSEASVAMPSAISTARVSVADMRASAGLVSRIGRTIGLAKTIC